MTNQACFLVVIASVAGALAVLAQSSSSATSHVVSSTVQIVAAATPAGDVTHGKKLFVENCTGCHGATGGGGVGPSLKGEKVRKNQFAVDAWIKNPLAPMPKLFPSPLSEKDVKDVAAYVESL